MKRARTARGGSHSGSGFRDCAEPISRNLAGPGPRPALAGKAADDDGGVIYGHNRGSGEKEKEGGSREGKSGIWGQDISKTGYTQTHCTTMNEQEFDRIVAGDDRIRTRTSSLVLSFAGETGIIWNGTVGE